MAGEFGKKILSIAKAKRSRLILALDVAGEDGPATLEQFMGRLDDFIVGIKIGIPFLLMAPPKSLEPMLKEGGKISCS